MKWPVWKEVLGPTLLLGGLWLAVSTSTTIFMSWQDDAYQSLLTDSVGVIDSVGLLQQLTWKQVESQTGTSDEQFAESSLQRGMEFEAVVKKLRSSVAIQDKKYIDSVEQQARRLFDSSRPQDDLRSVLANALELTNTCQRLVDASEVAIEERRAAFKRYTGLVLTIRQILNIAGPCIGVFMGYRAASKLRLQISRITVRLEGGDIDLGKVEMLPVDRADLESLDKQVSIVQSKLQTTFKELQLARQEVVRSERLAAVGQLAAGVAHELRNPLTSVKLLVQTGFPRAVQSSVAVTNEEHDQRFRVIIDEIERMERTIQSLLDYAKPPRQHRTRHDLRDTLQRTKNLIQARAQQQRVQINWIVPKKPLIILGDSNQLQQVFVNVILNGIEAMPEGGQMTLQASAISNDPTESPVAVEVQIRDTGPGLPQDVLARLFEPFVTTKERGTGLGLAISRRIIEEHNGTLVATNCAEGGACFTLTLPEFVSLNSTPNTPSEVVHV